MARRRVRHFWFPVQLMRDCIGPALQPGGARHVQREWLPYRVDVEQGRLSARRAVRRIVL